MIRPRSHTKTRRRAPIKSRVKTTIASKRQMSHSYPPLFTGLVQRSFGKFDPTLESYPNWYRNLVKMAVKSGAAESMFKWMGYRKYGLRFEDIIVETPEVGRALTLLPKDLLSDRDDRIKQAFILSSAGDILPIEKQTKQEDDIPYLAPYLHLVVQENLDRKYFRPR